jgi:hypothetical protein
VSGKTEEAVIDDQVRQDIAFIRRAVEEGGAYATASSPDMLVWGVAVALGYLGTYAFFRGWSPVAHQSIWAACLGLGWLYSLRRLLRRIVVGRKDFPTRGPMAQALAMLWLGCGTFLTILAIAVLTSGDMRVGWCDAVVAGVLGIAFFASASLSNLPWLRWVAIAWWIGEIAFFALRYDPAVRLPLAAALMLVLLAGPGLVLMRRRDARAV